LDNRFDIQPRKKIKEPDVVPILDMLVAVIFFLLLSTTFIELSKQTIPPSGLSTITDPVAPPPLNPKLIGIQKANQLSLALSWAGDQPDRKIISLILTGEIDTDRLNIVNQVEILISEFSKSYPKEKTLQLGLESHIQYQNLISIIDGASGHLPDVVLVSYKTARAYRGKI
jgi:biopolymer transport protein ExbD